VALQDAWSLGPDDGMVAAPPEPKNDLHRKLRCGGEPLGSRKITKTRGSFPDDEAALKRLYVAIEKADSH